MTRAKEELYLCHARLREFRGQTLYAVPSMFLDELPAEGVETIDLSASGGGSAAAMEEWRGGSKAAAQGWADAGVRRSRADPAARCRRRTAAASTPRGCWCATRPTARGGSSR